jgi:hypothetical protein
MFRGGWNSLYIFIASIHIRKEAKVNLDRLVGKFTSTVTPLAIHGYDLISSNFSFQQKHLLDTKK